MKYLNARKSMLATATLAASVAMPAAAQMVLEEVIVTATKRESSLMETGIAITAFTSDKLQALGIDDLNDLSVNTPGLSVTDSDRITIRGVGIDNLAFGIDPGVATYTDGFYLRGVGLYRSNNFYDLDRIEVLRGPQGTLYGRNTAGGAVNMVSKKPEQEFNGEVNLEAGNEGYTVLQGMLNVPLSERFAWRVSASQIDRDPLQDNDAGPDIDELDNSSYSTTLRADWSANWTTDLRFFGYERRGRPNSSYVLEPYNTTTPVFPGGTNINHTYAWDQPNRAVGDESKTSHDHPNSEDEEFNSVLLTNEFSVGDMTIKYIGGYAETDNERSVDADWSSSTLSSSIADQAFKIEQSSHELQFISDFDGKLNFIGGLYYFESDEDLDYAFRNGTDQVYSTPVTWATEPVTLALANSARYDRVPLTTLPGAIMSSAVLGGASVPDFAGDPLNRQFWFDTSLEAKSYAAFGQLDYNISDKLNAIVGLRYSYDEKDGSESVYAFVPASEDFGAFSLGDVTGDGVEDFGVLESETHKALSTPNTSIAYPTSVTDNADGDDDWDNISGLLRLEYTVGEDGFVYGSISSGYRSGGFNLGNLDEGLDDFKDETLISYEVGYKGYLLDETLSLDVAAFYYDYDDLQVSQVFLDRENGTQGEELNNAGKAEVTGFEMQANWLLGERLSLTANYAYANAEYKEFETIDTARGSEEVEDLDGNKLNRAPENKVGLVASYWLPLGDMGSLTFSGSYSWVDEMYTDAFNTERGKLDSWGRTDARATWASATDNLLVTAWVKNIEDNREATDAALGTQSAGFIRRVKLTDPRMYGLRVTYRF
jgi:iron complex outermembrane recepter protein